MIRRIFIAGLAAIVPLVLTTAVIVWLFNFADGILGAFINKYLQLYLGYTIPGLGIIISVLLVFFIGLVLVVSKMSILRFFERLYLRIPVVKNIYFPLKKVVDLIFRQQSDQFKAVVMIEYPRKGIYSIGFITNKDPDKALNISDSQMYTVFIPFSPTPFTGYTVVVSKEEVTTLDMTIEEAVRIIVSGGILSRDETAQ